MTYEVQNGKYTLDFDLPEYKALPASSKEKVRKHFRFDRRTSLWVQRRNTGNYLAKELAEDLGKKGSVSTTPAAGQRAKPDKSKKQRRAKSPAKQSQAPKTRKKPPVKRARKFCGCSYALVCDSQGVSRTEAEALKAKYAQAGLNVRTLRTDGGKVRVYAKADTAQAEQASDGSCFATWYPVSQIRTDERRFQNRKEKFSKESVDKMVQRFDQNKLDPITVWRDSGNGKVYVLSGHSRLEAHKRLKLKHIPVRFFEGKEAEARVYGKVDANRSGTAENVLEDIEAFKLQRDGRDGVPPLSKNELRDKWGKKYNTLEAYSHLNTSGKFLSTLSSQAKKNFPLIESKAVWVGQFRKAYPRLTHAHENEIFDFLFTGKGAKMKKEEIIDRVNKVATRLDFDEARPLRLEKAGQTGSDARADTGPAQKRIREIDGELEQLRKRRRKTQFQEEKKTIDAVIRRLIEERERIEAGVKHMLKTQTSLF